MIHKKVAAHLDAHKVRYEHIPHKTVFTAYDLAHTLKKKLNEIAKTLVVKVDKKYVLVVLPAHVRVDLDKVKKILKAKSVQFAPEKIMEKVFKVKAGAVTPFGSLHGAEVLMDKALMKTKDMIVNAGSFTDAVRVKVKDVHKLEKATLADVSERTRKNMARAAIKMARAIAPAAKKAMKKVRSAARKRK